MALGPVMLSGHKLIATAVAAATIVGLALFIRYSSWGRQIRAVAQNRLGASLAGIDTARASSLVFTLSGALAALSGALLAPLINASPDVGAFPAIKSYVIVVLGGMGSMPGSIIASLMLGVLEGFGAVYISYDYRDTFGLVILMLVLLVRPQGLFGEKGPRGLMNRSQHRIATEFRLSLVFLAVIALVPLGVSNPYWLGVLIVSMYFALLACRLEPARRLHRPVLDGARRASP